MDLTANPSSTAALVDYLTQHGVTIKEQTPHGEYVTATATVQQWETLLSAEFYNFKGTHASQQNNPFPIVRTNSYTIPNEISNHVQHIFNTVHLPVPPSTNTKHGTIIQTHDNLRRELQIQAGYVTPALLNQYYKISSNAGFSGASQGVYEGLQQDYSPHDLATFQSTFGIASDPIANDVGGYDTDEPCVSNSNNCGEANLDVQYSK